MGSILGAVTSILTFLSSAKGQQLISEGVTEVEHLAGFVEKLVTNVSAGISAAAGAQVTTPVASTTVATDTTATAGG